MTECQSCHRPTQLFLCTDCTTLLDNMLGELPWLLDELEARIQRLDRVDVGTIGRKRTPDTLSVIDFDAAELAREIRKRLYRSVEHVAKHHCGRTPPAMTTVATKHLALWLQANVTGIARLRTAGDLYRDIHTIVGTTERGGQLINAINKTERRYFGPCTYIVGKDRAGRPRECGADLYDDRETTEITCPECGTVVNARRQLVIMSYRTRDDLFTEKDLLNILREETEVDQAPVVSRVRFYAWIKTGQLKPHGPRPRRFSLAQARQLRGTA